MCIRDRIGAWNDGMERLVGIRPTDDRDGCLQDVHWPTGAIGYFPTYTIGAIAAAQLFAAACAAHPGIPGELARGSFDTLRTFAAGHVHQYGARFTTDEVLTRATGRPLDADAFVGHLRRRYLGDA